MSAPTVVAPTYLTGKAGSVTLGSTAQPIATWSGTHAVGTFDATNSTTGGAAWPEATIESMNGSFTVMWKITAGQPGMAPGSVYALVLQTQGGSTYTFNALVTSIEVTCDIKGGVQYVCQYMSQGTITPPTA